MWFNSSCRGDPRWLVGMGGYREAGRAGGGWGCWGGAPNRGRAAEPGGCRAAQGRGGRERPPYKWAGGERPGPGERGGGGGGEGAA